MKMNNLVRGSSCDSLNKLLKTFRITLILLFLVNLQVFAIETDTNTPDQQTVITGLITDSENGEPVIGANIQVKGTTL
jgi:hypothetical protein